MFFPRQYARSESIVSWCENKLFIAKRHYETVPPLLSRRKPPTPVAKWSRTWHRTTEATEATLMVAGHTEATTPLTGHTETMRTAAGHRGATLPEPGRTEAKQGPEGLLATESLTAMHTAGAHTTGARTTGHRLHTGRLITTRPREGCLGAGLLEAEPLEAGQPQIGQPVPTRQSTAQRVTARRDAGHPRAHPLHHLEAKRLGLS